MNRDQLADAIETIIREYDSFMNTKDILYEVKKEQSVARKEVNSILYGDDRFEQVNGKPPLWVVDDIDYEDDLEEFISKRNTMKDLIISILQVESGGVTTREIMKKVKESDNVDSSDVKRNNINSILYSDGIFVKSADRIPLWSLKEWR